jgi:hypothetical protein
LDDWMNQVCILTLPISLVNRRPVEGTAFWHFKLPGQT